MQPLNTNESPNQRSQTPHPLRSPDAVEQTATQPSRPTPRKTGSLRSTTDVTEYRRDVLREMRNEMIVCKTWEDGFYQYLPDIGVSEMDAEIDRAVTDLTDHQLLCETEEKQLRFRDFLDRPSTMNTDKEKCFKPLVSICGVLANRTLNNRKASSKLVQQPNKYNMAETGGANFKVDAYLRLQQTTMPEIETTSEQHIADLAVPCEYKLKTKDVVENRAQLLSDATFCMNDDPRRMHIYGITIEDSTMAVWYFSRSHSAKSPDFDFVENPRIYIQVMLSLLFANEEELGYDQTVQRQLEIEQQEIKRDNEQPKKKLCFVYQVRDRYFKTRKAIFDNRGLCITGRATRVWEVIEVGSFTDLWPLTGATPVVLKDAWLNSGSKTESENLRDIFVELEGIANRLKEGGSEPEAFTGMQDAAKELLRQCLKDKSWKQYFLSVLCDWQGLESKKVPAGARPLPTLFDQLPSTTTSSSHPYPDRSRSTTSHPTNLLPVANKQPPRNYRPKRHYRVVFREVCEALHDVGTLHDVAIALQDCVFALQLMFVAGWVHRDISTGNVYAFRCKDPGSNSTRVRGLLADLEYAKPFKPDDMEGSSDPKTGTAYFMAVEIQKQMYFYEYGLPKSSSKELSDTESSDTELSDTEEAAYQGKPKTPTFVMHNFQHDLESIFWILLWTLLARFPPTQCSEDQAQIASSIFQNTTICPVERDAVFTREGQLEDVLRRGVGTSFHTIIEHPETLRRFLREAYIKRGSKIGDLSSYSRLHYKIRRILGRWSQRLTKTGLLDLKLCWGKQDLAAASTSSAVKPRTQVRIKRERSSSNGGEIQIYKSARVLEAADVASSRTLQRKNAAQ